MRAHFNYDGRLDDEIPCRELGLNFQKSDIMEVSNEDDPNWWQVSRRNINTLLSRIAAMSFNRAQ